MSRPPHPKTLQRRTTYALRQARTGHNVVIVVDQLTHTGHIMTELELHRRDAGEVLIRASGRQGLDHTRSGGRIRFAVASNPDSLRGLAGVDVFLVDPRVATSTALEEHMALACRRDQLGRGATIVRPGDVVADEVDHQTGAGQ